MPKYCQIEKNCDSFECYKKYIFVLFLDQCDVNFYQNKTLTVDCNEFPTTFFENNYNNNNDTNSETATKAFLSKTVVGCVLCVVVAGNGLEQLSPPPLFNFTGVCLKNRGLSRQNAMTLKRKEDHFSFAVFVGKNKVRKIGGSNCCCCCCSCCCCC